MSVKGWIGVDLDGTLAVYDHWRGLTHIGEPIMPMLRRVTAWLAEGQEVRIFTARVSVVQSDRPTYATAVEEAHHALRAIQSWCLEHIGVTLEVTCQKDFNMIELWDDRAVQVERNTGRRLVTEPEGAVTP